MKIIIFGANDNCIKLVEREIDLNKNEIVCFLDNDERIQGKKVLDVIVDSPENIKEYTYDYIFIVSTLLNHKNIINQLVKLGVDKEKIVRNYGSGLYEKTMTFDASYVCKSWIDYIYKRIDSEDVEKLIKLKLKKNWCYENLQKIYTYLERAKLYKPVLENIDENLEKCEIVKLGDIKFDKEIITSKKDLFYIEFLDIVAPNLPEFEEVLVAEGLYEQENVNLNEGDVVIDCGANVGLFSAVAASKVKKGGKVYSFEPVHNTYKILQKTGKLYDNIETVKKGLSNKNELMEIDITSYDENMGTPTIVEEMKEKRLKQSKDEFEASKYCETIEVLTLDEFVKNNNINRVDFIKADIEGAERLMLEGARMILKEFEPKLSICTYHLPDDPEVLEKIILDSNPNYVIEHKWCKLYAYVPSKDTKSYN